MLSHFFYSTKIDLRIRMIHCRIVSSFPAEGQDLFESFPIAFLMEV